MKQIVFIGFFLIFFCIAVNAETLYLKSGQEIQCDNFWIENDNYICECFGGIISFDKKQIDLKKMNEIAIVRAKKKQLLEDEKKEREIIQKRLQKEREVVERIEKSKENKKEQILSSLVEPVHKAVKSGQAEQNLGFKSYSFGSQAQANALLKLIKNNPEKNNYQITYNTSKDTVIFGCNFKKDVLLRIHQKNNGHGSQEMWRGYALERLKNANSGGSINDTPEGKKMGIYQSF